MFGNLIQFYMDETTSPIPSEESEPTAGNDTNAGETSIAYRPTEARVRIVLLGLLAACMLGALLGSLLYLLSTLAAGWDAGALNGGLGLDPESASDRWHLRSFLAFPHFGLFTVGGGLAIWLFYRRYVPEAPPRVWRTWREYLGVGQAPRAVTLGLTMLVMLAALPLVLYAYQLNRALPLPEVLRQGADDTNAMLKVLLNMESPVELLANLLLVGLLPALGEELIFRGVLQQQLMRRLRNPWVTLVLSAAIFSFIHFQFDGFLPRLVLGFLLGWLYWRTHNFWVPVTAHFFNNGAQVIAQYLYNRQVSTVDLEQDITLPWYSALFSLVLVVLILRSIPPKQTTS